MKIYILTSAAVLTEDGNQDYPEIRTQTFLSILEAQLEMNDQFNKELKEAKAHGYEIIERGERPTDCVLSYGNVSQTDIAWEITEQDVPVSSYNHLCECGDQLKTLVIAHGRLKGNETVLLIPHDATTYVGGWMGEDSEEVDALFVKDGTLYIATKVCAHASDEMPSDDFESVLEQVTDNLEYIKMYQKYYRPRFTDGKDYFDDLDDDYVFPTEEDVKTWMDRHGFLEGQYEIKEYSGNEWLDEVKFITGDGEEMEF